MKGRRFVIDDKVFIKNLGAGSAWLPEKIVGERGLLSYQIDLEDGREVSQHVDHVRTRSCESSAETNQELGDDPFTDWNISSTGDGTSNGVYQPALPQRSGHVCRVPDRSTYWLVFAKGEGM